MCSHHDNWTLHRIVKTTKEIEWWAFGGAENISIMIAWCQITRIKRIVNFGHGKMWNRGRIDKPDDRSHGNHARILTKRLLSLAYRRFIQCYKDYNWFTRSCSSASLCTCTCTRLCGCGCFNGSSCAKWWWICNDGEQKEGQHSSSQSHKDPKYEYTICCHLHINNIRHSNVCVTLE